MSDELSREELEAQLESGKFEEVEPESVEEEEESSEPQEPPNYEERAKELEQRLSALEDDNRQKTAAIADERERRRTSEYQFNQLIDQIRAAREASDQRDMPDPEEDELGYLRHQVEQQSRQINQLVQGLQGRQAQSDHERAAQQMQHVYLADIQRFNQEAPDFQDACKHLYDSRKQELEAMGYSDPNVVHQAILAEEAEIVRQSLMNRVSPAQRIYQLAKLRGYQANAEPGQPEEVLPKPKPKPKSLGAISGASGALPDSFDAKVNKVAAVDKHADLMALDPKELDKLLRQYRI